VTEPKFVTKVQSLLGYGLTKILKQQSLAGVLSELGVSVFNPTSVEEYKARKRSEQYNKAGNRFEWTWKRTALKDYQQPVPLGVLQLALRIAERLPEAKFSVDQLSTHGKLQVDPFLVVLMGPMEYYIAQWDEPTFSDEQ